VRAAIDREQHWWTRVARRWVVAATLLLAAAGIAWHVARGTPVDAAALSDSVGDHIACALTTPANATYDAVRVARRLPPQFAGLAERFIGGAATYRLVDAHACPYKDRVYTHFVFRDGGRTVSLFLDDHPHGALPAAAVADEGSFRVSASETAGHQVFVVCDRGAPGMETLVDNVLTPSLEFVRELERHR
jgi:hypothetical protein